MRTELDHENGFGRLVIGCFRHAAKATWDHAGAKVRRMEKQERQTRAGLTFTPRAKALAPDAQSCKPEANRRPSHRTMSRRASAANEAHAFHRPCLRAVPKANRTAASTSARPPCVPTTSSTARHPMRSDRGADDARHLAPAHRRHDRHHPHSPAARAAPRHPPLHHALMPRARRQKASRAVSAERRCDGAGARRTYQRQGTKLSTAVCSVGATIAGIYFLP